MNTRQMLALLVCLLLGSNAASAAISPNGDVLPAYAGATPWNLGTETLYVGYTTTGELLIDEASVVSNAEGYLAYTYGSNGTVTVTGPGSTWNNSESLFVGYHDEGILNILDGATVTSNAGRIAGEYFCQPGIGTVTVDGEGSSWNITERLYVGISGYANLYIRNGATVSNTSGWLSFGANSESLVEVTDPGSTWDNSEGLIIGDSNLGHLYISNGATVNSAYGTIGKSKDGGGSVTVRGAGSYWNSPGELKIGEFGGASMLIENGGRVDSKITYIGYYGNNAVAIITGTDSLWNIACAVYVGYGGAAVMTIDDNARVNVEDGINLGTFSFGTGRLNLHGGTLDLNGTSITAGEGSATFDFRDGFLMDAVSIDLGTAFDQLGGTLAPGGSIGQTDIVGGYNLKGGTVEIELGGIGNIHDQITVTGDIDIYGTGTTLNLQGIGPMAAGTYTIIESIGGSITGMFEHITGLGEVPGLVDVNYEANAVTITLHQDYVPEPSACCLLLAGSVYCMARRRA